MAATTRTMPTPTDANMLRFRLRAHAIGPHADAARTLSQPGDVVAHFGAMQAQDFAHAKWAVGIRCPGTRDAEIERAIAERKIVRTWAMRGTLQLIAAADARWLVALVADRVLAAARAVLAQRLGTDPATFLKIDAAMRDVLKGEAPRTRAEVYAELGARGIDTREQRGYSILARAALSGQICQGPRRGKNETYVWLDDWLPPAKPMPREVALGELARRYFQSHGPATLKDFAWWSSLLMGEARAGLERAQPQLREVAIGGVAHWLARDATPSEVSWPDAQLLPGFDEYVLGYADRSAFMPDGDKARMITSNGIFKATILLDGRAVGVWTRPTKRGAVVVEPHLFVALTRAQQRALAEATEGFGEFVGGQTPPA